MGMPFSQMNLGVNLINFLPKQEELDALRARLEKVERERNEFKQANEILETRVSRDEDVKNEQGAVGRVHKVEEVGA